MNMLAIPPDHPAVSISTAIEANSLGMRALLAGDSGLAIGYFARACALDPQEGALWRNLAAAYRNLGDDAGELAALEGALDRDRADFMAWLRKAQLHERRGEKGDALHAWNGVVQMAEQIIPLPESLVELVSHGRSYVTSIGHELADEIEDAIGDDILSMEGRDQRRMRAFVNRAAGKRRIYQNECAGLYYPFLPADEFFDDHHFPWFGNLALQADAIREELFALIANSGNEMLRPYVRMDKGTPNNKWSELDHSLDWSASFLWEYGEPNEAVLEQCPRTKAALEEIARAEIPGRAPNAFFSILKPKAHIPPHTGVSNTRAIIHLPLIVPENCGFRVGGETREWVEGQAFAFDDTIEHEAWNNSDKMRAVLIFDVWNPHLSKTEQEMIARFYASSDAAGLNSEKRGV